MGLPVLGSSPLVQLRSLVYWVSAIPSFFERPIQQRSATARSAVLRKDILHLTARKTGIHNMPKSGGRKGRPQGCSLCSHRLRRLKPLTPTLSPAAHSAMPSMLPCCTSDLNRRSEKRPGTISLHIRAWRDRPLSG